LSTYTTSFAQATYSDVSESDWFYSNLMNLTNRAIIDGYTDGTFKPDNTLLLDQFIKLLVTTEDTSLTLDSNYWAYHYIDYAFNHGILNSTYSSEITLSNYGKEISRYEATYLLSLMLSDSENYDYVGNLPFTDLADATSDQLEALYKCYSLGLISGYPDGEFKGTATLSRAEATALISRLLFPQQRDIPINMLDSEEKDDLIASYSFDTLKERTNLYSKILIGTEDITYTSSLGKYTLASLDLLSGQEKFISRTFVDWNNEVISLDDDSAYLSTTIYQNSFRMTYTCAESPDQAMIFSSNVNGKTTLTMAYDLTLDETSSIYTLLNLLANNYTTSLSEEIFEAILTGYETANTTSGYDNIVLVGDYSVTSSAGEDYIYIQLIYPE
jgi:hypothetical protein